MKLNTHLLLDDDDQLDDESHFHKSLSTYKMVITTFIFNVRTGYSIQYIAMVHPFSILLLTSWDGMLLHWWLYHHCQNIQKWRNPHSLRTRIPIIESEFSSLFDPQKQSFAGQQMNMQR